MRTTSLISVAWCFKACSGVKATSFRRGAASPLASSPVPSATHHHKSCRAGATASSGGGQAVQRIHLGALPGGFPAPGGQIWLPFGHGYGQSANFLPCGFRCSPPLGAKTAVCGLFVNFGAAGFLTRQRTTNTMASLPLISWCTTVSIRPLQRGIAVWGQPSWRAWTFGNVDCGAPAMRGKTHWGLAPRLSPVS